MRKFDNHYLKTMPKYEAGTFSRYYNSSKYSSTTSSKHRNYYASSEDEKTNSKTITDKTIKANIKNKSYIKLNTNSYPFCNSQKIFNEGGDPTDSKNKNTIVENFSHISNHAYISLNSIIDGNNSLKFESKKKFNYTANQPFKKNNSLHLLNYNDNYNNLNENIIDKYNNSKTSTKINVDNKYKKHTYNLSQKLIDYDSNSQRKYNTINEENTHPTKLNSTTRKNTGSLKKINNEKESGVLPDKTKKNDFNENRRVNNLSLNIKKNITLIPNKRTKNDNNKKNILIKKIELNKIKKLSLKNLSNFSNLNDSSKKNTSDKNNHSFYERKSISREFPHKQTEIIALEGNKTKVKIKNNVNLNLSNNESSLNRYTSINGNKEVIYIQKDNNLFKIGSKSGIKDKTFNIAELNKYLIKEKKRDLHEENKKNYFEIINKEKNNNNINFNYNRKYNKNDKIGNIQLKKQEKNNNMVKLKNDYKISKLINNRNNTHIETYLKVKKYIANKINSYSFNYVNKTKERKNKKNKKFVSNKKLMTLKNLNYKTFEEDFPLKIKNYKRYKYTKNLRPQISVRITLFSVEKLERKRYFNVNFFYSENIRNFILEENNL